MTTKTESYILRQLRYNFVANNVSQFPVEVNGEFHHSPSTMTLGPVGHTSTREDRRTDYRERIRLGLDATTNVQLDVDSVEQSPYAKYGYVLRVNSTGNYYANVHGGSLFFDVPVSPITSVIGSLTQATESKFLASCYDKMHAFAGATFIGELRETIRMIRNPAKQIFDGLYRHHKVVKKRLGTKGIAVFRSRGRLGGSQARKNARDVAAGSWLQYRFGIAPLLSEINEGAKTLADFLYRGEGLARVPVKETKRSKIKQSSEYQFNWRPGNAADLRGLQVLERVDRCTYRGAVNATLSPELGPSIQTYFGLDWQDAVLAGWEIIPYSFLVDYFVNIGDLIKGSMFPQSNLTWCNRSTRSEMNVTRQALPGTLVTAYDNSPSYTVVSRFDGEGGLFKSQKLQLVRTRLTPGSLHSRVSLSVPGTGSLKWLNMAALASLRFP